MRTTCISITMSWPYGYKKTTLRVVAQVVATPLSYANAIWVLETQVDASVIKNSLPWCPSSYCGFRWLWCKFAQISLGYSSSCQCEQKDQTLRVFCLTGRYQLFRVNNVTLEVSIRLKRVSTSNHGICVIDRIHSSRKTLFSMHCAVTSLSWAMPPHLRRCTSTFYPLRLSGFLLCILYMIYTLFTNSKHKSFVCIFLNKCSIISRQRELKRYNREL